MEDAEESLRKEFEEAPWTAGYPKRRTIGGAFAGEYDVISTHHAWNGYKAGRVHQATSIPCRVEDEREAFKAAYEREYGFAADAAMDVPYSQVGAMFEGWKLAGAALSAVHNSGVETQECITCEKRFEVNSNTAFLCGECSKELALETKPDLREVSEDDVERVARAIYYFYPCIQMNKTFESPEAKPWEEARTTTGIDGQLIHSEIDKALKAANAAINALSLTQQEKGQSAPVPSLPKVSAESIIVELEKQSCYIHEPLAFGEIKLVRDVLSVLAALFKPHDTQMHSSVPPQSAA